MSKNIEYIACHEAGHAVALALIDDEMLSYGRVLKVIENDKKNPEVK